MWNQTYNWIPLLMYVEKISRTRIWFSVWFPVFVLRYGSPIKKIIQANFFWQTCSFAHKIFPLVRGPVFVFLMILPNTPKSVRSCIYKLPKKCEFIHIIPPKTARVVLEKFDGKVWKRKVCGREVRGQTVITKYCYRSPKVSWFSLMHIWLNL